jgi:multisubunit Na+/H+ antiporter MnhB subunit
MLYGAGNECAMLFKIIAFLAATIPIVLFVRSVVLRRPSRMREGVQEFRKQVDFAIWGCVGLIGCIVAFALGKLLWAWWTAL